MSPLKSKTPPKKNSILRDKGLFLHHALHVIQTLGDQKQDFSFRLASQLSSSIFFPARSGEDDRGPYLVSPGPYNTTKVTLDDILVVEERGGKAKPR